jgi:glycosyltransferase involved in cell wall biosynthesis
MSARNVFFSLVVPTYNRAHLIGATLQSLLAQTEPSFELIVVDDGSTDNTEAVVRGFSDPRLRYFRKANGERGAARNFGTAQSCGQYLNFFDSDDLAYPNHLAEAKRVIEARHSLPLFHLRFDVRTLEGCFISTNPRLARTDTSLIAPETLLGGNSLSCNGVFLRRDVALSYPFDEARILAGTEDWVLWLRLVARFPFFENEIPTTSLSQHQNRSVSMITFTSLEERARHMRRVLQADAVFIEIFGTQALDRIEAHMHTYAALHAALGRHGMAPVFKHLATAARRDPRELLQYRTLAIFKHLTLSTLRLRGALDSRGPKIKSLLPITLPFPLKSRASTDMNPRQS